MRTPPASVRSRSTSAATISSGRWPGTKWEVVKGLHVLRHSMISCMAAAGIDQRIIDDIVGHTSEEMRKRYRHLTPAVKNQAVMSVFG